MTPDVGSTEAEQAVLGGMLLERAAIEDATEHVDGTHFHDPRHESIFRAITRLHNDGKPVDPLSVAEAVVKSGDATRVEVSYVAALPSMIPVAANTGYYAEIVREAADRRAVLQAATKLSMAANEAVDVETLKAEARAALDALDAGKRHVRRTFADILPDVLDADTVKPLTTPWPELDRWMTGLRPGCVYVVAARPGIGKTIVATMLGWNVAMSGRRAVLFSVEMTEVDVSRRILSAAAGVHYGRLMGGWRLHDEENHRISDVLVNERARNLTIVDQSRLTVDDIRAQAREMHREPGGLALVVIDYLQLLTATDKRLPRHEQVAEQSRALKILAGEMGVPVVILAQLNRMSEQRPGRVPLMSDLRESGAVEQDADGVVLLRREDDGRPDEIDFVVAKNRYGQIGTITLDFEGHYQRINTRERYSK